MVRIDSDDEKVAQSPGALKITDVANMKGIETPVGEEDGCAIRTPGSNSVQKSCAIHDA